MTDTESEDKQSEVNTRIKAFVDEYGELVKKHDVDFATYPVFVPDGQGGFKIVCQTTPVDMSNRPKPSPLIQQ